jgi:hypothetical protein
MLQAGAELFGYPNGSFPGPLPLFTRTQNPAKTPTWPWCISAFLDAHLSPIPWYRRMDVPRSAGKEKRHGKGNGSENKGKLWNDT